MSGFKEYASHDAVGLAALIAKGDVTAEEALESALAGMAEVQPKLNAVVHDMEAEARRTLAAGVPDGPFAGVPFMLKDLNLNYAGQPTGQGSRFYEGFVPDRDSELVVRQKAAGLVVMAKTNTPEFGLCATTEPVAHGAAPNPWNLAHSCGGSSGGSASVVAAGVVPAAHATDGGGSIRIPAACSGLVGLKTTRGRNPVGPDIGESLFSVGHVVCRTVRDTAHFLDATAGPELGAPHAGPASEGRFADALARDPGRLRIAVATRVPAGRSLDPACASAIEATAALLTEMGHTVEAADPPIDYEWMGAAWRRFSAVNCNLNLARRAAALGRPARDDELEPITRLTAEEGAAMSATEFFALIQEVHAFGRQMAHFHEDWDVLLTPTLAAPPIPLGQLVMTTEDYADYYERLFRYIPFTPVQNLSGQPAITLPLNVSTDGLPIGVQFAARFGGEALLIALAARLEEARPWIDRRPPVWVG